jgi:lipopolysaccharide/colanic/teichoic acid biosynthesis glycosyltransferase
MPEPPRHGLPRALDVVLASIGLALACPLLVVEVIAFILESRC